MALGLVARRAALLTRLSVSKPLPQASSLIHRRNSTGASQDPHEVPRGRIWESPLTPSLWHKGEFVLVCIIGWGFLISKALKWMKKKRQEGNERRAIREASGVDEVAEFLKLFEEAVQE